MKKQSGFTLIELVIVVVILGFLAVTAIPKFIDLTDQAKQANIEGMAGGFATGVSLARAQWEAEGRPTSGGRNVVNYDGTNVLLTSADANPNTIRAGYIVASVSGQNDGNTLDNTFDVANCIDVWNSILQQPPKVTSVIGDIDDNQYFVTLAGAAATTECKYHLKETLAKDGNGDYIAPANDLITNFFSYFPATSAVAITINN